MELVDVRENKQIWGDRYEPKVSDLMAVQREMAKEISANLRLKLSGAELDGFPERLARTLVPPEAAFQVKLICLRVLGVMLGHSAHHRPLHEHAFHGSDTRPT